VRARLTRLTERSRHEPGLSKLSSVRENNVEVDVILGELNSRTTPKGHQTGSAPTGMNFRIP
jgi:hypothetical protein